MRVLVTGANGQVGKELQLQAVQFSGLHLIALDKSQLNIAQEYDIAQAISKHEPDLVINAAAYTAVDRAEVEVSLASAINSTAIKYLAESCRENNIPIVHISTDYVFDGESVEPYSEIDQCHPMSVYGDTKHKGENFLRELLPQHLILRTSWVFSSHGNNFVKTILHLAQEREELRIVSDQFGGPTSARDIALTLLKISERLLDSKSHGKWGTYHYCGTPATNWYEFAQAIVDVAKEHTQLRVKKIIPITTEEYPTPAQRPKNSVLLCDKIMRVFDVKRCDWRASLQTTISELMRH